MATITQMVSLMIACKHALDAVDAQRLRTCDHSGALPGLCHSARGLMCVAIPAHGRLGLLYLVALLHEIIPWAWLWA